MHKSMFQWGVLPKILLEKKKKLGIGNVIN